MKNDRVEQVGERLDDLYHEGQNLYRQGKERVQTVGHAVGDYVQERPLTSMLIAAGVGLVLGMILTRR